MNAALIIKLLDALVIGAASIERLQAARARLATIAAEGRDPSDAEWAELIGELKGLGERLDRADRRLSQG